MAYALWMKNGLRRHGREYLPVLAVLFCAVFALAFFSAYADSVAYGEQLQAAVYTRRADIVVRGGSEADAARFADLSGVTVWFADGEICLRVDEAGRLDAVSAAVNRLIRESGLSLRALTYDATVTDAVYAGGGVTALKLLFSGIALISMNYMLQMCMARRREDIAALLSLGAQIRQVAGMLAMEAGGLLLIALCTAIPAAGGVLRWMIAARFSAQIRGYAEGYVVYRFSAGTVAGVILLAVLTAAVAFGLSCRRYLRKDALEADAMCFRRDGRVMRARAIGEVWPRWHLFRERGLMGVTLLLVVPVTACAVFAGHMQFYRQEARLGADFVISDPGIGDISSLDADALAMLEAMPGVARVEYGYTNHSFRLASASSTARKGRVLFSVSERVEGDAVYIDTAFGDEYPVGEVVSLVSMSSGRALDVRVGEHREGIGDDMLTFACSPAVFAGLTGIVSPPRTAAVYLADDADAPALTALRAFLGAHFAGFSDERAEAEAAAEITARTGWIVCTLIAAFAGVASVTLAAILRFTVEARRGEFGLLLRLGAERRMLRRLLGAEMGLRWAICALPGIGLGLLMARLGGNLRDVGGSVGVSLAAACIVLALFVLPTQAGLARMLLREEKRR